MKVSTLGSCIRNLRKQNGMTQAQLADILGVTDKAVSKWERNLSYPDVSLFPKLAYVLGTAVDDLIRECGEECRPSKLHQAFEMSRDIRTPLHIILGFVEIIRNNHDDPVMLHKYLDGIKVSGEYMLLLLDRKVTNNVSSGQPDQTKNNAEESDKMEQYLQERLASKQIKLQDYNFRGKRILVAEDMAVNREIAAEILKQTGAETEFAEDGQKCVEMVESAPSDYYDMILMDVMMPNMNGLEATKVIRSLNDSKKSQIPIIALTTNVSESDREAAIDAGMNAFMEKPVFVDRLFETIKMYFYDSVNAE